MLKSFRHAGIFRLAFFSAVLVGFVLALALAASPELHEQIHPDANEDVHHCLATMISGGFEDLAASPTVTAVLPVLVDVVLPDASQDVDSVFLNCSVLEHAPPVFS